LPSSAHIWEPSRVFCIYCQRVFFVIVGRTNKIGKIFFIHLPGVGNNDDWLSNQIIEAKRAKENLCTNKWNEILSYNSVFKGKSIKNSWSGDLYS
jgi:hypothetical protein